MKSEALHEAFVYACVAHDDAKVATVISDGLDVDGIDREGRAPLHYAAAHRNVLAAQLLVAAGATIDIEDRNGNTPLCDAVFYSQGHRELIEFLRDAGANPHHANGHGVTAESLAASVDNFDLNGLFPE